jgi:molybdate transport system substrate-binding protein
MRLRSLFAVCVCLSVVAGCAARGSPAPQTLTVLAAASLTEPFGEMGKFFEAAHPGVQVALSFAGSQQLAQQLAEGAPADVFASANTREMDKAVQSGRVAASSAQVFARNRLVVVYPAGNPAGLSSLQDLARTGVKLVLAAQEVPAGRYAQEFFDKAGQDPALGAAFKDGVLRNVASYEDNVKSVFTKVSLGEADAGIVYVTDISAGNADTVGRLEIPDALNSIATYPVAPLGDAVQPELAQAFVELVLSAEGQAILAQHGFMPAR